MKEAELEEDFYCLSSWLVSMSETEIRPSTHEFETTTRPRPLQKMFKTGLKTGLGYYNTTLLC